MVDRSYRSGGYGKEITKKFYLIRYQSGGAWYMGIVNAWDAYTAVSILERLRNAQQVDRPKLIKEEQLSYYRDNLKIEEIN